MYIKTNIERVEYIKGILQIPMIHPFLVYVNVHICVLLYILLKHIYKCNRISTKK